MTQKIFGAVAAFGFLGIAGTVGGLELETIGMARAVLQSLFFMGVTMFGVNYGGMFGE